MTINSYQSDDEAVVEKFVEYVRSIVRSLVPYIVYRGDNLSEYLVETAHGNWEGYSDAEIVAVHHFLHDLDLFSSDK